MYVNKQDSIRFKAIGFNEKTDSYYLDMSSDVHGSSKMNHNKFPGNYSAASLEQAATFLRDRYGLHVAIRPTPAWSKWFVTIYSKVGKSFDNLDVAYDSPAVAYAAAITAALDIVELRNKKEA